MFRGTANTKRSDGVCEQTLAWYKEILQQLLVRWQKFHESLPNKLEFPRSLTSLEEPSEAADLDTFTDSSKDGTSAAVYSVVHQKSGINQRLVAWSRTHEMRSADISN